MGPWRTRYKQKQTTKTQIICKRGRGVSLNGPNPNKERPNVQFVHCTFGALCAQNVDTNRTFLFYWASALSSDFIVPRFQNEEKKM